MMSSVLTGYERIDLAAEDLARFEMQDEDMDQPLDEGFCSDQRTQDHGIPARPPGQRYARNHRSKESG
jgi:hypothetical protein